MKEVLGFYFGIWFINGMAIRWKKEFKVYLRGKKL